MGEVMVRSLINFVAIVCVLVVIDSDVKLLGIGGFCNAQEMDDNMVEQMWIGYLEELEKISDDFQTFSGWSSFPRKSLRDKKLWHKVLPPTSSASSPRAEEMLPIFTPPAPASSPLLSFEFPSLSPNEKRLLKSVLPLPIGHSPPISPHFIPPMPKSRPQKPKLPPPPMPRIHSHPMPKSQNPPMPISHPPPIPKSPPQIPRSNPPPMPKSPPKKPKLPPPPMPRIHPHPMPKSQNPPMPKSTPQMPRSHPSMPRSHPPPMPKSPPKKPKLHPPPMPRIHPHPMPKSQNHPMPKSPPQMPRSHPSMPRSHPPPMSRSHHPPMPRSPSPLRPRSHPPPMPKSPPKKPKLPPPPMPRTHPHPMPKSQNHPMPKSPPQMPRSHPSLPRSHPPPMSRSHPPPMPRSPPLRPRSHPPPMPRSHHPPIPRRHRPPMPRSPLWPRSHPPQIPRSHPLRSRSPPPPRPRSHPPLRPRSHHPPTPRSHHPPTPRSHHPPTPSSHPPPRPRSHHPPMLRSPPLRPRSPTPMPRHHHPPMPRSHHPPMPRSPPLRPKSPTPMPRSHHPPMLKSPPMPKIPPQIPKLPLPPTTSPPPMPKPPPPSPLPMAEAVLPIFTPASTPSVPASSPLKSVLPLPIVHPPPIRPPIIPPMPEGPPLMPESPPEMPIFPPPPMPKSPPPSPLSPSIPISPPKPQDYDHVPSKDDHEKKKTIVSAVAGGTVGGITLVALILVCFVKKRNKEGQELEQIDGTNGTDGTNGIDDTNGIGEHVLNLSSVDHISAGAKQMPQSNENPPGNVKELKTSSTLDSPLVKPDMIDSHTSTSSATETKTPELTATKCTSSLLPPPPRLSAQGPAQPPKCVQAPAPPKGVQAPAPPKSGQPPAPPKSCQPPAPPKSGQPPAPPKGGRAPAPPKPMAPNIKGRSSEAGSESSESGKAKLKPFFWDKVNASPNRTMVWHELKCGSFEVNEEKMESLFGYSMVDKNHKERKKKDVSPFDSTPHFIQIIEARKAQNLAILLKALNLTTEEVCDALKEGNELPSEFVQTLLKMAPTEDEELKLRLFTGNISQLAPADRFMKVLVGIPFAFKRMESLLFMTIFQEEISSVKQSFATLEVASKELSNSRLFLKLLEAVLKTGNRMNVGTYRGGAEAFKLDTLLKLSDVKGTDGKTSLLHFVVQEISRSEGLKSARRLKQNMSLSSVRTEDCVDESSRKESAEYYQSLGLQVLSKLGDELENVKKAAIIDHDNLAQSVAKLEHSLSKAKDFLDTDMKSVEEETEFKETLENFLKHAGEEITRQVEEEKRIMEMVTNTGDYFHGKTGKDEGTRLFVIVRDFLVALDKVCKEVEKLIKPANTTPGKGESQSARLHDIPQQLFPAFKPQLADDGFSSDDES